MFRRSLVLFIALLAFCFSGFAQSVYLQGNNHPLEGAVETYTLVGTPPPGNYTIDVVHGDIVSMNNNPANGPIFIQVRWNFSQLEGLLTATNGSTIYSYRVDILDIEDQGYCITINPTSQSVTYGVEPANELTISNCAVFGTWGYVIQYQWEEAVYIPNTTLSWNPMFHQNDETLRAPALFQYGTMAYRRAMYIYDPSGITLLRTVYSNTSLVSFLGPITSGSIIDANSDPNNLTAPVLVNLYSSPQISQTPATNGLCYQADYMYTWQISISNGPWTVIGTGAEYPAGVPLINANCRIRRQVVCGNETLYSNILYYEINYLSPNKENLNYLRELTVLKKGVQGWEEADNLPIGDKLQSTTYLDGFGRPVQDVERGVSPAANNTWKDLVKHYEYDAAGRSTKDFLEYATADYPGKFKPDAATAQPTYIRNFFGEPPSNAPTHSVTEYESSPLNKVTKVMEAGQSWSGSNIGVSITDDFNYESENVHIWSLAYSSTAIPSTSPSDIYVTGKLFKSTSVDEKGNKTISYTDLSGKLILKKTQEETDANLYQDHRGWVCTYYVYDDFDNLRFIISPKAVKYLDNNGWSLTQDIVNDLCYKYLYDDRERLIVKKKPGIGEEVFVYDKKDRIVLSQDANQKTKKQWSFNLYDELSRTVATGLFDFTTDKDREVMQSHVNTLANGVVSISVFVGNGTYQALNVDNPIAGSSGTDSYCNGCNASALTYNSITHYDEYSYVGAKSFNVNNQFAYSASGNSNVEPTEKTNRTTGFETGEKTRVVDADNNPLNDKFLFSTVYYDEMGRELQVLSDNYINSIINQSDYETVQYDFSGSRISIFESHSNGASTFTVISKIEYDKIGRLSKLHKNFNNTFYKQLSEFSYDELGQLKTKRLAPGYNGSEIEKLTYDYNILGLMTGINKDYALSDNNYSQWDRYFGIYLGYDNRDNIFSDKRLDGNITGVIWRSQGDNSPRRFDYTYDKLNRFTSALFKQKSKPSDAWMNSETDFSTYLEYEDGNGNIKSMKHMGIIPGSNVPVTVDDLLYQYKPVNNMTGVLNGNKLGKVTDGALGANNGLLGDFKDETPSSTIDDYEYDANGNLVKDYNKSIIFNTNQDGVTYNFLNKPEKIVITNKSTIEFTYDASGEKLSKKVTPVNGTPVTTWYVGDFVYQETELQFILHEEGRLKIITSHAKVNEIDYELNAGSGGVTWPGGKQGVFEYFIKDHLGSTRMVLTEEVQKEFYKATMESGAAAIEEPLFGKVNPTTGVPNDENELRLTRLTPNNCQTTPWQGNCTDIVKLTASQLGKNLGPNMILKVMAGDIISSKVDYFYYTNNDNGPSQSNPASDVILSLIDAIRSPNKASGLGKSNLTQISNQWTNNSQFTTFINNQNAGGTGLPPRAYLNIVFLDEQFKFIEPDLTVPTVGSGSVRVDQPNVQNVYKILEKKAPKNGWVFVYLSNQSNESVYFDNFIVTQEHSRIAEENHYYPYGLKIAGISSKAYNKLDNKYDFQGDNSEEESETGWNEFDLRMYDPQIGRWTAADPEDVDFSPYIGMGNNPMNMIDPDGADPDPMHIYYRRGNKIFKVIGLDDLESFLKSPYNKEGNEYIGTTLSGSGTGWGRFWGTIKVYETTIGYNSRLSAILSETPFTGVFAYDPQHFVGSSSKGHSTIRKGLDYVPVVGPLTNAVENAAKGRWGKALLNLGSAALDYWTLGAGSFTKLGAKEIAKRVLIETGDNIVTDAIGFSPRMLKKMADVRINNGFQKHHSWSMFLGGPVKQKLTKLGNQVHKRLHKDLNNFLKKIKAKTGIDMVPSAKNSGKKIRKNVSEKTRWKAQNDFYKGPGAKYKKAAQDFKDQFGKLY